MEREFAAINAEIPEEQEGDNEAGATSTQDAQSTESSSEKISKASAILEAEEQESHGHLIPERVDTSFVRGKIVQVILKT